MKPDEREKYKGNDAEIVQRATALANRIVDDAGPDLDRPKRGVGVSP